MSIIASEPSLDHALSVEVCSFQGDGPESQQLQKIAKLWELLADQKWRQASSTHDKALFWDSKGVCENLAEELSKKRLLRSRVYLCKDRGAQLRAIATISWKSFSCKVVVELLATNPLNLNSALNKPEDRQIRGAGSLLVRHIEADVLRLEKTKLWISDPLFSAIPFYKKIGFIEQPNGTLIKTISVDSAA
jgi:hypothetical protein